MCDSFINVNSLVCSFNGNCNTVHTMWNPMNLFLMNGKFRIRFSAATIYSAGFKLKTFNRCDQKLEAVFY